MDLSKYSILKCFFGQIWSQKLKFSKLTEIWCRHTQLYPCFKFNVNLKIYFFGQIWSQNRNFSKLTEIWHRGALLYAYTSVTFFFSKIFVIHSFLGKFGPDLVPNFLIVNRFSVSQHSNCYVRVREVHFLMWQLSQSDLHFFETRKYIQFLKQIKLSI